MQSHTCRLLLCRKFVLTMQLPQHCASKSKLHFPYTQGRNEGGTIPRAPIHYGGAESLRGRRITAGAVENSQQCHKYFLQYSKFTFERAQIPPWGAKLVFCPGRHPTSLRPCVHTSAGPIWTKTAPRKWIQITWKRNGSNHEFHLDTETGKLLIAN